MSLASRARRAGCAVLTSSNFTGALLIAAVSAWTGPAIARQKPGTFGYVTMPWLVVEQVPGHQMLTIAAGQAVQLAVLEPPRAFLLQRDLPVRKGHVLRAGTVFAQTLGEPLTLCETRRRPEANYVECFTEPDAAGQFAEQFPVSLSYAVTGGVRRQFDFLGRRYFDSKAPVRRPVSLADFVRIEAFPHPLRIQLQLVRVEPKRSETRFAFCTTSDATEVPACGEHFRIGTAVLPARFSTPYGEGVVQAANADKVTLTFAPDIKGVGF